jgi:hypothetical protein
MEYSVPQNTLIVLVPYYSTYEYFTFPPPPPQSPHILMPAQCQVLGLMRVGGATDPWIPTPPRISEATTPNVCLDRLADPPARSEGPSTRLAAWPIARYQKPISSTSIQAAFSLLSYPMQPSLRPVFHYHPTLFNAVSGMFSAFISGHYHSSFHWSMLHSNTPELSGAK